LTVTQFHFFVEHLNTFREFENESSVGDIWILKVKESRNRPSVAQRVPGGLGSQISMTFGM
jgi:hypothetical protein